MSTTREATRHLGARAGLCIGWSFALFCALVGFFFLLIEALFIAAIRGPKYVGWVGLSRCDNFHTWMTAEWRYYGRGGMQIGTRKFGLEVARKGHLSPWHPLI